MGKTIITVVVLAALAYAAFYVFKTQKDSSKPISAENPSGHAAMEITKEEFLTKVANFEQSPQQWKYLGNKPAIVDFYASWCGPCKMLSPVLEELAKEYKDEIVVYKVNTENEQELATAFRIQSIPALLFIPMEGEPKMMIGALPKPELKKVIDEFLLGKK